MEKKNVYYKGFIYEGCEENKPTEIGELSWSERHTASNLDFSLITEHFHKWLYQYMPSLPNFKVIGQHSFVDMREVVEGKDYKLRFQVNAHGVSYYDATKKEYDIFLGEKRIIALPRTSPIK